MKETLREKNARQYAERKAAGGCLRCGGARSGGHSHCADCLLWRRQWKAARRWRINQERAELAAWRAVGLTLEPRLAA